MEGGGYKAELPRRGESVHDGKMRFTRKGFRDLAAGAGALVFSVCVLDPVGEFWSAYWKERGVYQHPTQTVDHVIGALHALASNTQFHWIGGIIIGFAAGVWFDLLLKQREAEKSPKVSIKDEGNRLKSLAEDMLRYIVEQKALAAPPEMPTPGRTDEWSARHGRERLLREQQDSRFNQNFSVRITRAANMLRALEIYCPPHLHSGMWNSDGLARYFGFIGELLVDGKLAEAQAIDHKRQWEIAS